MTKLLFFDTETFSDTPIQHGTHRYAANAEILVAAWALDDGPVSVEDLTAPPYRMSDTLRGHLADPDVTVVIHKSDFDRNVCAHNQIHIPLERTFDTMVCAMAHSLPGSLDKLCEIFKINAEEAKDKEGKALIQLFCKPLPKNSKVRRATRETHPDRWAKFLSYAGRDITAMRALYKKLPRWNYSGRELDLWRLDQRINERGVAIDMDLARAAVEAVAAEQQRLKLKGQELTGYDREAGTGVESLTQRDVMLKFILSEYGVDLPDMKASTLERRMDDPELPEAVRQLMALRLSATTSSTSKWAALLRSTSEDDRLKGSLQFCGALRTGRWAGRLFQPQNLPRPDMKTEDIETGIAALKTGLADLVVPDVIRLASNALRGAIVAQPGYKLFSSDLKNIEGRVAAWLAGEQWKLDAFAAYDAGTGPDLYALAYAKSFNVSPESVMADYKAGGEQRQVGKVQELALAYEGGVGAFLTFALVYRLDLEEMARTAYDLLPLLARQNAEGMLAWRKKKRLTTYGLTERAFVVCEAFKALWREAHPATSSYWKEMEQAAIRAVRSGQPVRCRKLGFVRNGAWLRMILPSGRSLCYPSPQINSDSDKLTYAGVNQYNRQWGRIHTYGGKLFENATQALARDVMGYNMPAIEDAGFEIMATVHDDVIAEAPDDGRLTSEYLSTLLATSPPWLTDCPLAADGFEAYRYRK